MPPVGEEYIFENLVRGQPLKPVLHELSAEFVERYRYAIGEPPSALASADAVPSGIATLLSTAVFRAGTAGRIGDLHVRHEYEQFSPLHVGQRTLTTGYLSDKYLRGARRFVVYDTLTADAESGLVHVRCRVTLAVTR